MVWKADTNGLCSYISDELGAFLGRSPDSQLADGWLSTIHHDDLELIHSRVLPQMAAQRRFVVNFRVRAADGSWVRVKSAGQPRMRDGEVIGYTGTVRPLRKRLTGAPGELVAFQDVRRTHAVHRCVASPQTDSDELPRRMTESL